MKLDKYMGIDVHQATSVVAVLDAEGKIILETIVATEAAPIIRLMQSLSGPLHVTFEETTQAAWLYDVIRAYVLQVVVCDPEQTSRRRFERRQTGRTETGRAIKSRTAAVGVPRT